MLIPPPSNNVGRRSCISRLIMYPNRCARINLCVYLIPKVSWTDHLVKDIGGRLSYRSAGIGAAAQIPPGIVAGAVIGRSRAAAGRITTGGSECADLVRMAAIAVKILLLRAAA